VWQFIVQWSGLLRLRNKGLLTERRNA